MGERGVRSAEAPGFTIVLKGFSGEGHEGLALEALAFAHARAGLPEAHVVRRSRATLIALGWYADARDPEAQRDLARVRGIVVDGEAAYPQAMIAPTQPDAAAGANPEFDLRTARSRHGERAVLYTLQVGVYGRSDQATPDAAQVAEFRRLAEQAVDLLRREGDEAYYFHGPSRSTVTVGVFTTADYDASNPRAESARLRAARKKHPHNLLNGMAIRNSLPSADDPSRRISVLQPSLLVEVPRNEP